MATPRNVGKRKENKDAKKDEERKEALQLAARKRIALEKKALKIVERLLEDSMSESFFEDCGKFITSKQFEDVAVERSIEKLCGYPLCANELTNTPKQQYHISLKTKKVYDITERKYFCSQFCYKAFKYYQAQLTDEPLWTRDHKSIPPVKLLLRDSVDVVSDESLRCQDEVMMKVRVKEDDIDDPPKEDDHREEDGVANENRIVDDLSVLTFADQEDEARKRRLERIAGAVRKEEKSSLRDDVSNQSGFVESSPDPEKKTQTEHEQCDLDRTQSQELYNPPLDPAKDGGSHSQMEDSGITSSSKTGICNENLPSERTEEEMGDTSINASKQPNAPCVSESPVAHQDVKPSKKKKKKKAVEKQAENPQLALLKHIQQCLMEWRSEATMVYLYGDAVRLKGEIKSGQLQTSTRDTEPQTEYGKSSESAEKAEMSKFEKTELELESGMDLVQDSQGLPPSSKPLPHMADLRQDMDRYALKVREFYAGRQVTIPSKPKSEVKDTVEEQVTEAVDRSIGLPPVDSKAQVTIRRKILLDRLSKVLPQLTASLHLPIRDINPMLTDLVRTFHPSSHNIVFKPVGWTLLAIVLLHLLAIRDDNVKGMLQSEHSVAFLTSMMDQMGLHTDIIRNIVHQFDHDISR